MYGDPGALTDCALSVTSVHPQLHSKLFLACTVYLAKKNLYTDLPILIAWTGSKGSGVPFALSQMCPT